MKKEPKITMSEWQSEISKLSKTIIGPHPIQFTKEQDEQILYAFKNKILFREFLEWFKKKHGFGSKETIRNRYLKLTDKKK